MIREISEEEAYQLAKGRDQFTIIIKEENEESESAVCLKKFPTGYVLGVSCDTRNLFKLYFSESHDELLNKCEYHLKVMRKKGHPFDDLDINDRNK